jgi:hypothetical protein
LQGGVIATPEYVANPSYGIIAKDDIIYPNNPKNSPDSFRKYETKAYINIEDGSIWEKDTAEHGGSEWKRWNNIRDWNNRKHIQPQSVWESRKEII